MTQTGPAAQQGVQIRDGAYKELRQALDDDDRRIIALLARSRGKLFADGGYTTSPAFGNDELNPRAGEIMAFHDQAYDQLIKVCDENMADGAAITSLMEIGRQAVDDTDAGLDHALDEAGSAVGDVFGDMFGDNGKGR